ncbi:MAG: hypothetical protein M1833_001368 [Piccolia ochrophora]|nr:MAG: hypothetical protein M1833_001368 [Piccolia ochrophora]
MSSTGEASGKHHHRPGNSMYQRTQHFRNGSSVTFGPYDALPVAQPGQPFFSQFELIDNARADMNIVIAYNRRLVPPDAELRDERLSEGDVGRKSSVSSSVSSMFAQSTKWRPSPVPPGQQSRSMLNPACVNPNLVINQPLARPEGVLPPQILPTTSDQQQGETARPHHDLLSSKNSRFWSSPTLYSQGQHHAASLPEMTLERSSRTSSAQGSREATRADHVDVGSDSRNTSASSRGRSRDRIQSSRGHSLPMSHNTMSEDME